MATCSELWTQYQAAYDAQVAQQSVIDSLQAELTLINAEIQVIQAELIAAQTAAMAKGGEVSAAQMALMPLWMNTYSIQAQMQNQNCPFPGNA
jgi:hypothetical protein